MFEGVRVFRGVWSAVFILQPLKSFARVFSCCVCVCVFSGVLEGWSRCCVSTLQLPNDWSCGGWRLRVKKAQVELCCAARPLCT